MGENLRQPYKSLNPQWCTLCRGDEESIDHIFLRCSFTIGLWQKLFNLAKSMWDSPRNIEDMFITVFRGFGNSTRGKT